MKHIGDGFIEFEGDVVVSFNKIQGFHTNKEYSDGFLTIIVDGMDVYTKENISAVDATIKLIEIKKEVDSILKESILGGFFGGGC